MYNPDIFDLEIDKLEAQKDSDQVVKEYRFNIDTDLAYQYALKELDLDVETYVELQ